MTSKLKIDTLETLDGTGTIALNNQLSGMTTDSLPTLTAAEMPAGSVVQVQTFTSSTNINTPLASSTVLWNMVLPLVGGGNKVNGIVNISTLMEHTGSKHFWVEDAAGAVLGAMKIKSAGQANWRMPATSLIFTDASPVTGSNTYTLKATSNIHLYFNYPTDYGNGVSSAQLTEIKG